MVSKAHLCDFYKSCLGLRRGTVRMAETMRMENGKLSKKQQHRLIRRFTVEEMEAVLEEMKTGTTLGSDGFLDIFYKQF
jgi:hypothetical protein